MSGTRGSGKATDCGRCGCCENQGAVLWLWLGTDWALRLLTVVLWIVEDHATIVGQRLCQAVILCKAMLDVMCRMELGLEVVGAHLTVIG